MIKNICKLLFTCLVTGIIASSCTKDPDVGATSTVEMAGEWWVKYYLNNTVVNGYEHLLTYNTANPDAAQVWVEEEHFGIFKSKFDVDYANLAFKSMASTPNTFSTTGETLKVVEGKILKGVGRSLTGHPVDSIFLRIEFSSSPGDVYEIRGHYDTGFFEDHP